MIIALNCLMNSRYQLKLPIKWSYSILELCSRVCSSPLPPTFVLIYIIYFKFNILLLKVRCYSRCHRKNPYRTVSPMFSSPRSPLYVLSLLLTFYLPSFFSSLYDDTRYYGWANTFYNTQEKIGWYRTWYDDENWMAMALLRAYDILYYFNFLSSFTFQLFFFFFFFYLLDDLIE